ncbi:hypothetical protein A2153_00070 [Candidatus Gottesmanbacteria bacterium RBG_16_38_7b]|uniref:Uncharacterized protein n=1 Tax=Candidatus Gottesmanbacteria bacterium RBG_16_38_7b TaxID=1798372 RepID=A0A1F5YKV8_9BACT|nr:MAG: hypothetical protein A2153_00070 [Candidatus Gottesmanbacteria bacterium RBG_16_38_7b]
MRKYYIFITVLGVVTLGVLIGGFKLVGTPISSRLEKLDSERLSNFNTIKYKIEDYYRNNGYLPDDLRLLSGSLKLSDPKTGKAYDYVIVRDREYKLCSEFATDTWQSRDDENSSYSNTENRHRKGYDCIGYTISSYVGRPTPTMRIYRTPTPAVFSYCPGSLIDGECKIPRNCRDSDGVNIYGRGSVSYNNPNGPGFITVFDQCAEGVNQVRENICQADQIDATNLTWTEKIYDCPNGCMGGACVTKRIYPIMDSISPVPVIKY